jgi:hypothetical protein
MKKSDLFGAQSLSIASDNARHVVLKKLSSTVVYSLSFASFIWPSQKLWVVIDLIRAVAFQVCGMQYLPVVYNRTVPFPVSIVFLFQFLLMRPVCCTKKIISWPERFLERNAFQ